jgi:hypothetical protein
MKRISIRAIAALSVAALIAAWAFGFLRTSNDGSLRTAEARAFLTEKVPDSLDVKPGQVLHTHTDVYTRFGPKAAEIAAGTGIMTENHVRESWQQIADDGSLAASYARVIDATGAVVQESVSRPGEIRSIDPRSNSVIKSAGPDNPITASSTQITTPKGRALAYEQALRDGRARVLNQTPDELSLEISDQLPQIAQDKQWGPGEYQVPYTGDLRPTALITKVTVRADGVVTSSEGYALTSSGKRVLIQSEHSTTEILDQLPALPF